MIHQVDILCGKVGILVFLFIIIIQKMLNMSFLYIAWM